MTYKKYLKEVKYTDREVYIPILNQWILKSSFVKDGEYSKKLEEKFLKAVYDKRQYRTEREQNESVILEGLQGSKRTEK